MKLLILLLLLLLTLKAVAREPLPAYILTVHYATPSDLFPGVQAKKDEPSTLPAVWRVTGQIPTTAAEAMDPRFKAGITNETLAQYLEGQEGAPVAHGQLLIVAAKIRAMRENISKALYAMENGNSAFGTEWEYDGETGVAKAKFPFRGYTIFVWLERMPLHVLLPVE